MLGVLGFDGFFNGHVAEFAGFKNVATFLAFDIFCVVFTSHDAHTGMAADFLHRCLCG